MKIHDPENQKKFDKVYAFISRDENGNEGLLGVVNGNFSVPLICGEEKLIPIFEKMAIELVKLTKTKKRILLIEFQNPTEIREIVPYE